MLTDFDICTDLEIIVGENQITGFQMFDILHSKKSQEEVFIAIRELIALKAKLDVDPRILADALTLIKDET